MPRKAFRKPLYGIANVAAIRTKSPFEDKPEKVLKFVWTLSKDDLRVPPSNRLEALKGARKGQFSIRINRQWRICFAWHDGHAFDVEITDYH